MRLIKEKKVVNEDVHIDFFTKFIASASFTGYIPFASGTFGSLFALLFFLIPDFYNPVILMTLTLIFFFVGIVTSNRMMQRYGDDPAEVVIDEVIGMWVSLFITVIWYPNPDWKIITINFFLFRVFDIIKIYPANYFDKLKSGFGVMFDDVVSGVFSGFLSVLIIKYLF